MSHYSPNFQDSHWLQLKSQVLSADFTASPIWPHLRYLPLRDALSKLNVILFHGYTQAYHTSELFAHVIASSARNAASKSHSYFQDQALNPFALRPLFKLGVTSAHIWAPIVCYQFPPPFFFWVHSMWDLSPWPEIKPVLSEVEAQSLNSSPPGKSLNSFLQAPIISLPTSLRSHLSSHLPTELWTVRQNSCHMRHLWLSTVPSTYQRVIYRGCVEYRVWVISWVNAIPETLRHETKDWNTEMEGNRAARGIIYGGVEIDYLGLETWWRACREGQKGKNKKGRNKYYGCRKESWVAHPGAEKKKAKLWHPLHPLLKLSFMCDPSVCAKSLLCWWLHGGGWGRGSG